MINARFYLLNNRKVHYLVAGEGAPIVLLHPSPSSSKAMIPLIKVLAEQFTVIAPDTPGYGGSDSLPHTPQHLRDYCQYFRQFFQAIGLNQFAIYGSATGAQMGIRYALEFPADITQLYLDNSAHFTDRQRDEIVASYFPDISPQYDGSHLMTIWTMVRDLFVFFPWCFSKPAYRLKVPFPPAAFLHQIALDYMEAGSNYHLAYRLAFEHEKAAYVQALKVPTKLFYWEASIVKPYVDQLLEFELPENVEKVVIPKDRMERYQKMKETIVTTYQSLNVENAGFSIAAGSTDATAPPKNASHAFIEDLPSLIPDENGLYLIKAWFDLRDRQLYKNPAKKTVDEILHQAPNLDSSHLQSQLIEWMKK